MKDGFRVQRVEKELQALIAEYFLKKLPLPAPTHVTRVQSNKELRSAKVFLHVMGDEEAKTEVMELVEADLYSLQGFLNRNLRMKHVPRVSFILDQGFEHMMKIEDLISSTQD